MEKLIIHTKALSRFMQLLDGSFPSGSFVHSYGLEAHVVLDKVSTIDELEVYLTNILIDQYQKFEFGFINRIFKHLEADDLNSLFKEDKSFSAMLNFEYSKASHDIGHNYLKHICTGNEHPIVISFFEAIKRNESPGNELAVLAAYAYELGLEKSLFIPLWCKKNLMMLASCTLKISCIKPSEIQQMLFHFDELLEVYMFNSQLKVENFNPLFEEVIYQHIYLEPKLFMT